MQARGFSLIELMVVLAILGVVVMAGGPSMVNTIQQNRVAAQINEVKGALSFARSEGAKRSQVTITLCPSDDGAGCTNTPNWEVGFIVLVDIDGDRVVDAADGDVIVKYFGPLSGDNTLRTFSFDNANFIQMDSDGFPASSGTFVLCDDRGAGSARAVVMNISGQTRFAVDEDADGIVNHPDGNAACPA
ncbi:MAG: GspH/FimT family pseudopilin [Pseudomonadales bacterium]|nr:GspH/FimT family pseudopilin [Pseudomonadales bacterium]